MADKTFNQLDQLTSPADGDIVAIADIDDNNTAKRTTVSELAEKVNATSPVLSVNGQTGDVIVSGGGGDTYYAGNGLTLDGNTFSIDSTAAIHVAGISSDGGITFPDGSHQTTSAIVSLGEGYSGGTVEDKTIANIIALSQSQYDELNGGPANDTLYVITDGKNKDSYVGQIDTLADDTYTIDPYVVSDREISRIYVSWSGTSGGTLDVQANSSTVGSKIDLTGSSPSNQDLSGSVVGVSAGQNIRFVAEGVDGITNVAFAVEYTQ